MARKRVLLNALSAGFGGGRSYLINLFGEIGRDDRGFDFTVLALRGALDGIDRCGVTVEEVELPRVPSAFRVPLRVAYEQVALPWRARRHDLLYCVADVAPLVAPVPVVVLMRNLNIYDRTWDDTSRTRTLAKLARLGAPRAARVLFPTRAAADRIAQTIPVRSGRVRVVPYGVDPKALGAEEAGGTPRRGTTLFLPAAPERHKNISVVVRALRILGPPWELRVVGESSLQPEHRGELEALARSEGVADRVHFLGSVSYRRLGEHYRATRALVFPSYHETFGHPILEAMATGTPIVASDIPTFRELAEGVALFFPPDDAEALASSVRELERDPEGLEARVASGRERAAEHSWKRSVDRLVGVFDEVLGER